MRRALPCVGCGLPAKLVFCLQNERSVKLMNHYVTGIVIHQLREKAKLTQAQLAEKLCVSDKAVSKWETGVSHN